MPLERAEKVEDGLLNLVITDAQGPRDALQLNECDISNDTLFIYDVMIDVFVAFA